MHRRNVPGKNVALRREVIELLDREKQGDESYGDVILRLAGGPRPLIRVVEALERLSPVADDELTRRVAEVRRASRRDRPRRARL